MTAITVALTGIAGFAMGKLKVLNLYAGIGGNRKLWEDVEVTAIELDPKIVAIYQDFFPNDEVIVADAHQYLLDHYEEFDFIWSSPPCPTHSQLGRLRMLNKAHAATGQYSPPRYPDMHLYQEILFLKHFFKGKWIVENVIAYYEPLIKPIEMQRHWFWSNFHISKVDLGADHIEKGQISEWEQNLGYDLSKYTKLNKRLVLRNCVRPELGLHILQQLGHAKHLSPIHKQGALL